jgi:hypothetical protein
MWAKGAARVLQQFNHQEDEVEKVQESILRVATTTIA